MARGIAIPASWLRDLGDDNLLGLAALSRVAAEGLPLVIDNRNDILDDYAANLDTDSPGRRFVAAMISSGAIRYVSTGDVELPTHVPTDLRPYVRAASSLGDVIVLSDAEPDALPVITNVTWARSTDLASLLALDAPNRLTAFVMTALELEFRAILEHLVDVRTHQHPKGSWYHVGHLPGDARWQVAVTYVGPYNSRAAAETERALAHFNPSVSVFMGVAGGVKDVALGDVVVAEYVTTYDTGRSASTFFPRSQLMNSAYALVAAARYCVARADWCEAILPQRPEPVPTAHVAPVASGDKVVASKRSAVYSHIREAHSDVVAVEMEGYGFLLAAHINTARAVVIRGISDLISGKVRADSSGWQVIASRHASAFVVSLLRAVDLPA